MKAVLLALALLTGVITAAETAEITSQFFKADGQEKLVIRLSGVIEKGDADRISKIVEDSGVLTFADYSDLVIALDSPGGSYAEGLAIADVLRANFISTYVDDGAQCLSACSLAFMAGTDATGESAWPDRRLHPRARLGFHAPSLTVPTEGMVPVAQVGTAYNVALKSLSGLVGRMETMEFPRSLLEEMLNTPSDSMRIVETIDDINRWGIQLETDFPDIAADKITLLNLCNRYPIWKANKSAAEVASPEADNYVFETMETRTLQGTSWTDTITRLLWNEMDVTYCYVISRNYGQINLAGISFNENASEEYFRILNTTEDLKDVAVPSLGQPPAARIDSYQPKRMSRLAPPQAAVKVAEPVKTGTCLVYSPDKKLLDQEPCSTDFSTPQIERYIWPSGAVTVIDRRTPPVTINGKEIFEVNVASGLYCLGNSGSGNAFCYKGN